MPLGRLLGTLLLLAAALPAATETIPLPQLPGHARLAIWGDSITEMRVYSRYLEAYLLACAGRHDVTVCTFGHDGETLGALLSRQVDLEAFKPTVVSFNYGMNDARDAIPWSDDKGSQFAKTQVETLAMLAGRGIRQVVIAGPGLADGRPGDAAAAEHMRQRNLALGHFRDIGLANARTAGTAFADINHRMIETLERARQVQPGYSFLDIHPAPNGHLMMALEMLKALGCHGDIGTISVDLKAGASASAGHAVVSSAGGVVVVDSLRYPFCCEYDRDARNHEGSLASVLPFLPFQQEMNRLVLTVANLDAASAVVTWGEESREFTAARLAAGINLTQEFPRTPFDAHFARVMAAVADKQQFEHFMIKGTSNYFGNDAGGNIDPAMVAVDVAKDAALKALLVPLRHTIAIVQAGSTASPKPAAATTTVPLADAGPLPALPAITSAKAASATVGKPFTYRIEASNAPSGYFAWMIGNAGTPPTASSLPKGLVYDTTTGVLSGTPVAAGTYAISVAAMNRAGVTAGGLTLTVAEPAKP